MAIRDGASSMSKIIVSTLDLRPSLLSILQGLCEKEFLAKVATTFYVDSQGAWNRIFKHRETAFFSRFQRRIAPDFLRGKLLLHPFWELLRAGIGPLLPKAWGHKLWLKTELEFDSWVARHHAGKYPVVYGMEHSSLSTFREHKTQGGHCVLRQVMLHGREAERIIHRLAGHHPDQAQGWIQMFEQDSARSLKRKEEEYSLADLILANSEIVRESFIKSGLDGNRVVVIPTGCPSPPSWTSRSGRESGKLRFLFVGTLSLRKGIVDLLEAWKEGGFQKDAELWLAGTKELENIDLNQEGVCWLGALSRDKLGEVMRESDVFVLPTWIEGLSHSLLEAFSAGLPVLTTPHSGCGNLLQDQQNGFLFESGNRDVLVERMRWCIQHRSDLPEMGMKSRGVALRWGVNESKQAHLKVISDFFDKWRIS